MLKARPISDLWTIDDFAAILDWPRRTFERYRSTGDIPEPDLYLGKRPKWKTATVERFINDGGTGKPKRRKRG